MPALPVSSFYRRQFKSQEKFVKWSADERDYVSSKDETLIRVTGSLLSYTVKIAGNKAELFKTVEGSFVSQGGPKERPIEWSRVMLANGHNKP